MSEEALPLTPDDLVPLDQISKKYFNITPVIARRKAAIDQLPVPAFRLTNSGRGPFYVTQVSLDKLIADRLKNSTEQHRKMAAA